RLPQPRSATFPLPPPVAAVEQERPAGRSARRRARRPLLASRSWLAEPPPEPRLCFFRPPLDRHRLEHPGGPPLPPSEPPLPPSLWKPAHAPIQPAAHSPALPAAGG